MWAWVPGASMRFRECAYSHTHRQTQCGMLGTCSKGKHTQYRNKEQVSSVFVLGCLWNYDSSVSEWVSELTLLVQMLICMHMYVSVWATCELARDPVKALPEHPVCGAVLSGQLLHIWLTVSLAAAAGGSSVSRVWAIIRRCGIYTASLVYPGSRREREERGWLRHGIPPALE